MAFIESSEPTKSLSSLFTSASFIKTPTPLPPHAFVENSGSFSRNEPTIRAFSPSCTGCGSTNLSEESGKLLCLGCGLVLSENLIAHDERLFEGDGDHRESVGQRIGPDSKYGSSFIAGLAQRPSAGAPDVTEISFALGYSESSAVTKQAQNVLKLASRNRLTRGRRARESAAVAVYIACRQENRPQMLIDVSDASGVEVYEMGRTYLEFVRQLHLQKSIIDPVIYIDRFASLLNLGTLHRRVVDTANRLVQAMSHDWMLVGRRPSGLCAAALLIAGRVHGLNYRQDVISRIARICRQTLRKRLLELYETHTGEYTVSEFCQLDIGALTTADDPPAFKKPPKPSRASAESEHSKPIIPSLQWLIGSSASAEVEAAEAEAPVPPAVAGLLEEVERTGEQLQIEMERQAQRGANVLVGNLLGAAESQANSELPSSQDSGVGSSASASASSSQTLESAADVPRAQQQQQLQQSCVMLSAEEADAEESRLLMQEVLLGADEQELDESVAAMALAPSGLASGRREEPQAESRLALLASLTVDELRDEDLDRMLDEENVFLSEEEERLKERDWLAECGEEYDRLKQRESERAKKIANNEMPAAPRRRRKRTARPEEGGAASGGGGGLSAEAVTAGIAATMAKRKLDRQINTSLLLTVGDDLQASINAFASRHGSSRPALSNPFT